MISEVKLSELSDGMEKKRNIMGSEVVEGYRCKPVDRDPHRPILHFRHQIFLCAGPRCAGSDDVDAAAAALRTLAEETGRDRGADRIKITRSNCFGACRFRRVSVIYENGGTGKNNCVWLKRSHTMGRDEWEHVFQYLRDDRSLKSSRFADRLIAMEAPEEASEEAPGEVHETRLPGDHGSVDGGVA